MQVFAAAVTFVIEGGQMVHKAPSEPARGQWSSHCWCQVCGAIGVAGPWRSPACPMLLRRWPGASMPEGRRQPFKATFLCFRKRESEKC